MQSEIVEKKNLETGQCHLSIYLVLLDKWLTKQFGRKITTEVINIQSYLRTVEPIRSKLNPILQYCMCVYFFICIFRLLMWRIFFVRSKHIPSYHMICMFLHGERGLNEEHEALQKYNTQCPSKGNGFDEKYKGCGL